MGSAIPQKTMPVAMLLQRQMTNQLHLLIVGFAFSPPMRMLPIFLENSAHAEMMTSAMVTS